MSTNKKFRIQNGADIVGELSINDVTVIGADGKVVAGAIQDAVADLTASDIADLQSQVTAILGTSPETLDTLQEIVTAFQDADTNLVASVASNSSDIATINDTLQSGVATPSDIAALEATMGSGETSSGYLFVGAPQDDTDPVNDHGSVYAWTAESNYTQSIKMTAPVPTQGDRFGKSIGFGGGYLAVLGYQKVYLYSDINSSPIELSVPTSVESVAIGDNHLAVGGYGPFAYLWELDDISAGYTQIQSPNNTDNGSYFGAAVDGPGIAIDGNTMAIGQNDIKTLWIYDLDNMSSAPTSITRGENSFPSGVYVGGDSIYGRTTENGGKVHKYSKTGSLQSEFSGNGTNAFARYDIAVSGDYFVAREDSTSKHGYYERGRVLVYQQSNLIATIDAPLSDAGNAGWAFGYGVEILDGHLFVGDYSFGDPAMQEGRVYKYDLSNLNASPVVMQSPDVGYDDQNGIVLTGGVTVSSPSMDTSASTVFGAVNELHTEIESLSSLQSGDTSSLTSAIATAKSEAMAHADAGDTSLQGQIDIIVGSSPASLDTLQEIVTAFENADGTLTGAVAQNSTDLQTLQDSLGISTKLYVQDSAPSTSSSDEIWIDSTDGTAHKSVSPGVTGPYLQGAGTSHAKYGNMQSGQTNYGFKISATGFWGTGFNHLSYNVSKASPLPGFEFATPVLLTDLDTQDSGIFPNWILYEDGSSEQVGSDPGFSRYYTFSNGKKVKGITFGTISHFSNPPNNAVRLNHVWPQSSEWTQITVETDLSPYSTTGQMESAIATAKSEAISTASADATAKADAAETDAKAYADQVVAATVDAAPAALDTLNELAAALGDDANFASTVTASIATKASQVDHDAEVARATAAEGVNASAIAATNARTSGISTSSGSTDIQMTAEVDMDSNNIKNANDVYAARGFIDHIESNDLKVQTGTVDFEGSIVNFGSSTITGGGFGNATKAEVDQHLNIPTANAGEFVKWTGTDYEWTDLVSGRLATDQLQVASGGSITATGPGGTFDFQDGIVMLSGSDVRVDTPTDVGQAANKGYVDDVVAATVDAAPAALDTLNELAAALGDDANFSATVATSIGTKASQTDHDAEVAARIAADSAEASARSSADSDLQAEIDALEVLQSGDVSGLQSQITAEVARATSAEAVNAANIVSETSARSSADAALESDIIGLQNQVGTIIAGSPASLDTLVEIVSAFENADSDLSGVITANGGRLTTAENNITALETDLSAEESARGAGDAALQTQVTAHDGRLTTAEGEIDTLQAQMVTRIGSDSDQSAALAVETAARIAGDNANSAEVTAEAGLRSSADTALQSNIDSEESARIAADSDLQSAINAEVSRATGVEAGLQTQITNVLSNTDATALNSLAEIVTSFQNADSTLTGAVAGHGTRLTSLESGVATIESWSTDNVSEGSTNKYWTPERTKTALSGGLCITYNSSTGEIKIDEAETASSLHVASSTDANGLGGQAPAHYRIDVYDVNGTIVN